MDQYAADELPKAIQILFQETKGKLDSGYTPRSIQVLYSTLGRLFSLIGRYEESEICHRNALGLKKPSEWRVGQSFVARMRDVENAASDKKIMRRKVSYPPNYRCSQPPDLTLHRTRQLGESERHGPRSRSAGRSVFSSNLG